MRKRIKKIYRFPKLESNDIESTDVPKVKIGVYLICKNNPITCLPGNIKQKDELNSNALIRTSINELHRIKRNFLGSYLYEEVLRESDSDSYKQKIF